FARTEFQFEGEPRDACARIEGDPPFRLPSKRTSTAHHEAAVRDSLLFAEQPRFSAPFSCSHSAGRGILREQREANCAFCRTALLTENCSGQNRFAARIAGTRID